MVSERSPRVLAEEAARWHHAGHSNSPAESMLNRSAVVIGHKPAFYGWLRTSGLPEKAIGDRMRIADRAVYLVPACHLPEEMEEVIEDLFEDIFRRELAAWQPDESDWPDTGDFASFTRWFTVEPVPVVEDVGRGSIRENGAEE